MAGALVTAGAARAQGAPAAAPCGAPLARTLAALAGRAAPGTLAVAVEDPATGRRAGVNAGRPMPLQSVFKAFLGAAVLARVDAGALALDSAVVLEAADLSVPYSAIADAWPGRRRYTVAELLEAAAGASDNTAADVLMRLVGGPAGLTAYLRAQGVRGVRVDRYERDLQPASVGLGAFDPAWVHEAAFGRALARVPLARQRAALAAYLADPRDTATPDGALAFLRRLAAGALLAPASTARLLDVMTRTATGARRLRAGLPPGATLAHKTGTGRTVAGRNGATNDIGIVTRADGSRLLVAAFLAGSTRSEAEREALLAEVARAATACGP